jgi:hypothetical protein
VCRAGDHGHSRFFWGFRLHGIFAPDGTPRAVTVASPKRDERDVALELLARTHRDGPVTLVVDKGYAGKAFARAVSDMDATILRPVRKDESGRGPHLAPIRQRTESIFWSGKSTLTLERHGGRTSKPYASASCNASSPSPPPSPSTTNSAGHPAHSSTTAPKPWNQPSSPAGRP